MQDWSSKTLLVVEDVENNFELIEAILKKTNVKIIWAQNGKEALRLFDAHDNIDVVLMDIKLPDQDGLELTRIMKEKKTHIPIIAQTAYALTGDREKALSSGCDEYIPKPLQKNRLLNTLNEYLSVE